MQIAIEITEEDYNRIKDIPLSRFVSPITCDTLEYLEMVYTGARACDDVAEQVRLARAIAAYKQDVHEDCTVLDKVRAEIEQMDFDFGDYYDNTDAIIEMVCKVIDKYKKESEGICQN